MHVVGSEPYPWPYDGAMEPERVALLVVGPQRHWTDQSTGSDAASRCLRTLAVAVSAVGAAVVAIRYGATPTSASRRRRLPSCGSAPWCLDLDGITTDVVVDAPGLDAFYDSPLDDVLRSGGRDRLLLAGPAAELTVDSTIRGANDRGYECLVVIDACAAIDPAVHVRALDSVTMSGGIFGAIAHADAVIDALAPLATSQEAT